VLSFARDVVREVIYTPTSSHSEVPKLQEAEHRKQAERIVHSATLRGSVTLVQLFEYLVAQSFQGAADSLKEYTIGLEAFGRKPDFDPRTDTIVRVQTHRLRQKLKDYYEQEGLYDLILVEIPKGQYCPVFRSRSDSKEREATSPDSFSIQDGDKSLPNGVDLPAKPSREAQVVHFWGRSPVVLVAAVVAAVVAGYFAGNLRSKAFLGAPRNEIAISGDPVKAFWAAFLGEDRAPIIAYPNAVFLLDDSNDLLRFRQGASDSRGVRVDDHLAQQFASNPKLAADAGPLYYEDGYTGTGELQGVAMLTGVFVGLGAKPIIKTSRDITPQDLQEHSVILLGSPFQNVAVGKLFADGDFSFDNPDSHREQWRAMILNAHPQNGESSSFRTERDSKTQALEADYSLISLQPGVVPEHRIAVLGGLDTTGTAGATKFMTSPEGIGSLTSALAAKGISGAKGAGLPKDIPPFQALLRVQLDKGDQVLRTELTTVHPLVRKPAAPSKGSGNPQ
jgi:hypothetical protein